MNLRKLWLAALAASLALAACAPNTPQTTQVTVTEAVADRATATEAPAATEEPVEATPVVEQPYGDLYLFTPLRSTDTYLMDANGTLVYTWPSQYNPGQAVYLLENGNLLRTGASGSRVFDAGGAGGVVQEIAPDGSVVWEFEYASDTVLAHHDVELLPNGNVLMIAWELKSEAEAVATGRDPSLLSDGELWPDHLIEVDPATNQIVWQWHVWDHLVQDYDAGQANYGVIAEHPELIDINYTSAQAAADWTHINAIDYNAELDQILLSVHGLSEIWIIDHSITTEEAAGSAGDLLYRWGNPQAYDAGSPADEQLFQQHNAQWIEEGLPGAGNILIFNNGSQRLRAYSTVDEITPPLNDDGSYAMVGGAYGPDAPAWTYQAEEPTEFYADHISGVQRLANGNTLVCDGVNGRFFEVTPEGEVVWEYAYGGQVFRVTQIAADDPTLANLNLQAGETLVGSGDNTGGPGGPAGQGQQRPGSGGPPRRGNLAASNLSVLSARKVTHLLGRLGLKPVQVLPEYEYSSGQRPWPSCLSSSQAIAPRRRGLPPAPRRANTSRFCSTSAT